MNLLEFDACFKEFLKFRVVWEDPNYSAAVVHDFVGAFQVFEDAVEGLVLNLFWQGSEQCLLGWARFGFFDGSFDHEYCV